MKNKILSFFTRDVNEFNKLLLSILSVSFLIVVGYISYEASDSFAIFTDDTDGDTTIQIDANIAPNKPILSSNMIAVYYDETCDNNAGCWEKADESNPNNEYKWYDYDEKMWANSVTVDADSRSTYLNAKYGTKINMEDILTMQVWIPRFKYKVWNYNSSGNTVNNPAEIDITFEYGTLNTGQITCTDSISGTDGAASEICKIKSTGATCTDATCNGLTYTHPAFTFGDEEITGMWIAKFEASSDIECVADGKVTSLGSYCNRTDINPLSKPDVKAWTDALISVRQNNMMKMNDSGNIYGFSSEDDTHMLRNMDWAATAYFAYSKYGAKDQNFINNSYSAETTTTNYWVYTGRSGGNVVGSTSATDIYGSAVTTDTVQYNPYGYYTYDGYLLEYGTNTKSSKRDLTKVASTTGNIYGIYDMVGGGEEAVMANMVYSDGVSMVTGYSKTSNSGYNGVSGYGDVIAGEFARPDSKYFDFYSYATDFRYRATSKLGDGIRELAGGSYVENTYKKVLYRSNAWFQRGNGSRAEKALIFTSNADTGDDTFDSTRFSIKMTN